MLLKTLIKMDTNQINKSLKNYKKFKGTFPKDQLPKIKEKTFAIIINTDSSDKPGEHWVAIYSDDEITEYFDSFGLPPLHQEIIKYLDSTSNQWHYNSLTIQSVTSTTCGLFCVLYIKLRLRGYTYSDIIALFCHKLKLNDLLVSNLSKAL